jgi:hypothetical protein
MSAESKPESLNMAEVKAELDAAKEQLDQADSEAKTAEKCIAEVSSAPAKEEAKKAVKKEEKKLPKLSTSEFRTYNRMAEMMQYCRSSPRIPYELILKNADHNHFRATWTMMYNACEANQRPSSMSIRQFLNAGLQFCHSLTMHHDIEEAHIFPVLARKMPAFKHEMQMKTAHKKIHDGLEKLEPYLEACRDGETELNLKELKRIMDTFGKVLWQHLDEEVEELGAENMRKYWTEAEMGRMPF